MRTRLPLLCLMLVLVISGCRRSETTVIEPRSGSESKIEQPASTPVRADSSQAPAGQPSSGKTPSKPEHVSIETAMNLSETEKPTRRETVIQRFPVSAIPASAQALKSDPMLRLSFDQSHSTDGNGSIKIVALGPGKHTIPLYTVRKVPVGELPRLAYRAKVLTADLRGEAYLEMKVKVQGQTQATEGIINGIRGGSYPQWVESETAYFLKPGQTADEVQLNFVVDGLGTAWVDNLTLLKSPLPFDPSQVDPKHPRR